MKAQLKDERVTAPAVLQNGQTSSDGSANDNLFAADLGDPLFMATARREIAATRLW